MNKIIPLAISATLALGATGCATNQQNGALIGGVLGGIGGSQIGHGHGRRAAIIAGTLAGAAIGGAIGKNMDETDRLKAQHALETNRTNQTSEWVNPDSGYEYSMTPTRTYETGNGNYCREFQSDVTINGRTEHAYGHACRQPDGSWQITG